MMCSFVKTQSSNQDLKDLHLTVRTLQSLGFSINFQKSHLLPTTKILHLGTVIDSEDGSAYLSPERLNSIQSLTRQVDARQSVSILTLTRLLGKMVSCIGIVPWARLHSCHLQWILISFQRQQARNSVRTIIVSPRLCLSLHWWLSPAR